MFELTKMILSITVGQKNRRWIGITFLWFMKITTEDIDFMLPKKAFVQFHQLHASNKYHTSSQKSG